MPRDQDPPFRPIPFLAIRRPVGLATLIGYNPEKLSMAHLKRFRSLASLSFFIVLSCISWAQPTATAAAASQEKRAKDYLDNIRHEPSLLWAFLRALPKGGDLHNHLPGAIYAEYYIRWAADDNMCVDRITSGFTFQPCDASKNQVPAKDILSSPTLYQQVINAQSMRFFNGPESGHDHFFNTFVKFGPVGREHMGDMIAVAASQGARDNLSYLELILFPDKGAADRVVKDNNIVYDDNFDGMRDKLMASGLKQAVTGASRNLDEAESHMREKFQCGSPKADPGCNVTLRYLCEIHRGESPAIVFAELLAGFELAATDPRVLGINPVMPEDAYVPMRDFELHMRMIDYFHRLYPKVRLSLHAGELWTGLVPQEGLRNHIQRSIELGHAERIGHGVDVMLEDNPIALLKEMAAKKIAVEINLTSNDQILGVRGDRHPFQIYRRFGVPLAISTDDQGVARSSMTQEYFRAVRDYNLSYADLKQIVRNSLEFSFLPGPSLWTDPSYSHQIRACAADGPASEQRSRACTDFLSRSERARQQWQLEQQLWNFETRECCAAAGSSRPIPAHSVR